MKPLMRTGVDTIFAIFNALIDLIEKHKKT